jgi:hypothetical protein
MSARVLFAALGLALVAGVSRAGTNVFFNDFNDGTHDLIHPSFVTEFGTQPGSYDGSIAMVASSIGFTYEGFVDLPTTLTGNKVVHLSYWNKIDVGTEGSGQRLSLISTFSDSTKLNYRTLYSVGNALPSPDTSTPPPSVDNITYDFGPIPDWRNRFTIATGQTENVWRRVDHYGSLRDLIAGGAFRTFGRVLSADLQTSVGTAISVGSMSGAGGPYTTRQMKAIQFFNSIGNNDAPVYNVGLGNQQWFDDLSVQVVDAADLTKATRDAFTGTPTDKLSDFNNDNVVNSTDADRFILEIVGTRRGDTNVDFVVDFNDLLSLAQGYDQPGTWANGDFDGSGVVDFNDLLSLAQNYGFGTALRADQLAIDLQTAGLGWATALVPEPATLGILASTGLFLRRRRD